MVQGINPNANVGYAQPVAAQAQNHNQQPQVQQLPTKDEFVSQVKKAKNKSVLIGGTAVAASLLAMLGGTLMKTKMGRALSIIPVGLATLGFGGMTLLNAKKMGDVEKMVYNMPNN